ncbi:autophagy-related protein 8i, partial [Tanacetum coccineum]
MGKSSTAFKTTYSFEERCQESQDIIARYPDRLP